MVLNWAQVQLYLYNLLGIAYAVIAMW